MADLAVEQDSPIAPHDAAPEFAQNVFLVVWRDGGDDEPMIMSDMAWVMDTAGLDRSVARAFAAGCTPSSVANDAVAPDGNVRHLVRKRPKWRR